MPPSRAERLVAASLVCALLGAAPGAHAQIPAVRPEAQAHLDRALRHYQAREYAEAAAAIEAVYSIDPQPDLLYMWAQSKRLGGDCLGAIPLYRKYLETGPGSRQAELAQRNISRCEAVVAAPGAPPEASPLNPALLPPAPPPAPPPPAIVAEPPPPAPRAPWYRDTLGHALTGVGLAGLWIAGGLEYSARVTMQAALDAEIYDEAARHAESARRQHRLASGALVVGSTLVVAGILRYVLRGR